MNELELYRVNLQPYSMQWNEVKIDTVYYFALDTYHNRQLAHEIEVDQFPGTGVGGN